MSIERCRRQSMPTTEINGPIIPAGQSLSNAIDLGGGKLVRVTMPEQWTSANLTFQVAASEAGDYDDLFTSLGEEFMIAVHPGTSILVSDEASRSGAWVRFRSGTHDAPIAQQADRVFSCTIEGVSVQSGGGGDATPPVPVNGAMVDGGTRLQLNFNKPLDTGSVPATSAFLVVANFQSYPVLGVTVTGSAVKLQADAAYAGTNTTKVTYTPPGSNPLKGANGTAVAGFTDFVEIP